MLGSSTIYLFCGKTSINNGQQEGGCKLLERTHIIGCHD
jgi:hypothetical protein